jgi:uncharacterized repeat protein (TIGR01451 family)
MDVRVPAVVAATLLAFSISASAAINGWTAMGPSGGTVNNIIYSQDGNTAFMVAAGGFYRSQDKGVSWQTIKSDFLNAPVDVAIDPSNPARIYVVAANAPCLYVSNDGGATLAANTALPGAVAQARRIAVSQDGTTLYLSNNGLIFSSPDRGQTWQERTALSADATTTTLKLLIDPTDPKTLYAAVATASTGSEGIFATHDGAMTWQQLTSGTESASLTQDLAINPTNPAQIWSAQYDGIWVSADRGLHWSDVFSTSTSSIAIDPTNPAILYAGTPLGKVYRSANAGVNWADVSGNILAGENLHLSINPSTPTQLLAGGAAGISGSNSSGTAWVSQQTGFNATSITSFSADPNADRIYTHIRTNGVFFSASGAATILPVNNDALLHLSSLAAIDVTAILAQPGRLFVSLNNGLTFSTDGGATWAPEVEVLPPTGSEQIFHMTGTSAAPQDILASSTGAIAKSSDGGATWQAVTGLPAGSSAPAQTSAPNLLFAPSNPSIAYAAIYSNAAALGLYKSTDAGNSWAAVNQSPASSALNLLAVDPNNASIVYGSGTPTGETLLKSVDGGATWSSLTWAPSASTGAPNVLTVDPVHPNILYAAGPGRIGRSVDGGSSWETLRDSASSLPTWIPSALMADPDRPESLLVGTDGAGVQQITIAPNLTLAVTSPTSPLAIGAAATYTYTATNQGPFDATGVKVTVQLPATAQSVTASASGGNCTVSGLAASCIFPIVRKGADSSLTVTAVAPGAGGFQVSAAVVGDQPDSDPSDNAVSSSETVTTISDMSVTATGSAAAHVGDAVSYILVATNVGPNVAPAAQLSFQLAAGLTPGTVSSTDATCTGGAAGQVTCNLNDLAVAKAVTITVNATAAALGAQISTAAVTSGATDLVSANNSASTTTSVSAVPPANSGGGGGELSLYEVLALTLILLGALAKKAAAARTSRFF